MRAGLRAGVTGAAGGTGASAAAVTGCSGNQFLHSLPQQPGLRYTVEPTHVTVQKVSDEVVGWDVKVLYFSEYDANTEHFCRRL